MSWNIQGIVEDALTSSTRAIQFDLDGQHEIAVFYYREAAKFLELAISGTPDREKKESWTKKAAEYKERAEALHQLSEFLICSEFDGFSPSSSDEVKERELYLFTPSGSSWAGLGRTLPFFTIITFPIWSN